MFLNSLSHYRYRYDPAWAFGIPGRPVGYRRVVARLRVDQGPLPAEFVARTVTWQVRPRGIRVQL